ncbi:hypothetical protein OCH239_18200 [Roseivivax halodurans JCM 10272]|uniref:DUF2254 domain-containing protein n=1 Tax=Roseivivax halodurans JCM 10272 TaxID=1449350 RepID=X7EH38_9RHOB|nr:hypothetical protein OCH239_18200 [Roseivivax halodurans JCM 10272]
MLGLGRKLLRLSRRLSVRVVMMAVLALVGTAAAPLLTGIIPDGLTERFGRDAVLPVLDILASSMLAVTTFSLGVMVQAFHTASGQATPRAFRILVQDSTTQTVLGTFVGSFLFALTAIVMYRAGFLSPESSVVIALLTGVTITLIIVAILRWIAHLSRLGSMDHTLDLCERAAAEALGDAAREPGFGAYATDEPVPGDGHPLAASQTGHVTSIDIDSLDSVLTERDATLWLTVRPGDFVLAGQSVGVTDRKVDDEELRGGILIANAREQEQDTRFGLTVLAEIGARALSPGVNDPGTAIDVIKRQTRLLWDHARAERTEPLHRTTRIRIAPQDPAALLSSAYDMVIRDGADRIEVMDEMLRALQRIASCEDPGLAGAARNKHDYAVRQARAAIDFDEDRERLDRRAAEL